MSFVLGLDVGTASAAGATKRDGRVQPCALGDRTATLPAVVVLHDDGHSIVGDEAERIAGLELTRIARDLRNNPSLQPRPITVGGQVRTSQELLRTLYATMVQRVTAAHRTSPSHVVLTHPALPEGVRCEAVDTLADEMFPGALVVPDPVAATVKLACDAVLPTDCTVAVYDLGGGTFDTTIVQRSGDRFSVVGDPGGLADFGGIDLDDLVLDYVDRSAGGAVSALDLSDPAAVTALTRLRAECRDAKERLSYDTEVTIDASVPGHPSLVQLTRAQLEDIIRPRIETTVEILQETIERVGLRSQDIDAVALLGGSSRIPMVVDLLTQRTSMQVLVDPYPELTVALGAAQMVDDEAGVASVFPIADLALPSLEALGRSRASAEEAAGQHGAGGAGAELTGVALATPPGGIVGAGGAVDPTLPNGQGQGPNGANGSSPDYGPGDGGVDDLGARSGALVLVGLVGVLMVIGLVVALLGGTSKNGDTATDIASQINDDGSSADHNRDGSGRRDEDESDSSSSSDSSSTEDDDEDDSSDDRTSSTSTGGSTPSGATGSTAAPSGSGGSTGGGSIGGGSGTSTSRPNPTTSSTEPEPTTSSTEPEPTTSSTEPEPTTSSTDPPPPTG